MSKEEEKVRNLESDVIRSVLRHCGPNEERVSIKGTGVVTVASLRAELERRRDAQLWAQDAKP
jgi:hypothetical protein